MPRTEISSDRVFRIPFPHAQATVAGRQFYTTAIALDPDGRVVGPDDIAAQTRQCFANIGALLAEAGGSLDDVTQIVVFLVDFADFAAMNEVFIAHFPTTRPSRGTVRADLGWPAVRVEMIVQAVLP